MFPTPLIRLALPALLLLVTPAAAEDPDEEIRRLEERVAQLERANDPLNAERAAEFRALIEDVLHDAASRANLTGDGLTAGHDGGFFIADAAGRFRLTIGGRFHIRHVYNRQFDSPEDDHRSGFEVRRLELGFAGHALDNRLRFNVRSDFSRSTGRFVLLDGEVGWRFSDDWFIRAGQFRPGFFREDSVSGAMQLAVEQSLINARFAQNRMQGVELRASIAERLFLSGMVSDGMRSLNTPWQEATVEYALTGRAEWLIGGTWGQFVQFTSPIGDDPGLLIGGGLHWQRGEFGTPAHNELQMLRWTVDGQLSLGGASFFGAFIGSHEDRRDAENHFRWGLIVQGSIYLAEPWEVFVRYEHGDVDEGDDRRLSVLTSGVNWYLRGHVVKWSADVGVGLRPVGPQWSTSGAGWRTDAPSESGQLVVRSQLQLLF